MKFFKHVVLLFIIGFVASTSSLAQRLDLTPGTKRSYFRCTSPWPCPATVNLLTTNEVVLDTVEVGTKQYAKVSRISFVFAEGTAGRDTLISSEIVFWRFQNDSLMQLNEQGGDDFLYSYHISGKGEFDFSQREIAESGFFLADTSMKVLADTTIEFPNKKLYRVYWGIADTNSINKSTTYNKFLLDSMLIEKNNGFLIPAKPYADRSSSMYYNSNEILGSGFYFIDGIGTTMYPFNHETYYHSMFLTAFISADGDTMGTYYEPKFYVSTEPSPTPLSFSLHQNYPNPFNPTTTISYDLHEAGFVELTISDVNGRILKTLISNTQSAGHHHQTVDLSSFASGVYFYTLQTTNGSLQKQMTLVK